MVVSRLLGLVAVGVASCRHPGPKDRGGDDSDSGASPSDSGLASEEICNGEDDDGDGQVDEGAVDAVPLHPDVDGDGFGDAGTTLTACPGTTGLVDDGSDCDDRDAEVHPGAPEVCPAERDFDCDGVVAGSGLVGVDDVFDRVELEEPNSTWGDDEFNAGDLDGDGHEDLLSIRSLDMVSVFSGPITGEVEDDQAVATVHGVQPGFVLQWMSRADDADGDGFDDLWLSDPWALNGVGVQTGAAMLVKGPLSGVVEADSAAVVVFPEGGNEGGSLNLTPVSVSGGDVDGDGIGDVLVGFPGTIQRDTTSSALRLRGVAYLLLGPLSGTLGRSEASLRVSGGAERQLGIIPGRFVGDLDGDGVGDLWVSAYRTNDEEYGLAEYYLVPGDGRGDVDVDDLQATVVPDEDLVLRRNPEPDPVDIDGDGYLDLLVTALRRPVEDVCSAVPLVFSGPIASSYGTSEAVAWIEGIEFGCSARPVATAHTPDGAAVVLVGDAYESPCGSETGAVHAFIGPLSGTVQVEDADWGITGVVPAGDGVYEFGEQLGSRVNSGGDLLGDGGGDFLIAVPHLGGAEAGTGGVLVVPAEGPDIP